MDMLEVCDSRSCDEVEKLPTTLGAEVLLRGPCVVDPVIQHPPLNARDNLDWNMTNDELSTRT